METFAASLALCVGNPLVTGGFPPQWPMMRCLDVFFDLRMNKRLSKQSKRRWFETPSFSLWRACNASLSCRLPADTKDQGIIRLHPTSQISQCIRQISHNAPSCNRNVHTCAYFSYKIMYFGIWNWYIVGFVQQVYSATSSTRPSYTTAQLTLVRGTGRDESADLLVSGTTFTNSLQNIKVI